MELDVASIPTLVAGGGTLLFGAAIIGMSPQSSLHRAFGLFCALRGGMLSLHAFSSPTDDLAGRISVYLLLAIPFATVWLAHVFLRHDSRRSLDLRLAWLLLVGLLAVEGLYLYDHSLFFGAPRPLGLFFSVQFACYAALGYVFARKYSTCPPGPRRRSLYPLALALVAEPAFWAAFNVYQRMQVGSLMDGAHLGILLLVLGLCAATAIQVAQRGASPEERLDRWRFLAVLAVAAATGVGAVWAAFQGAGTIGTISAYALLNSFWTLFLVAATAYAIVRYRLFTIDLRVKAFLRHGATAAVEGILFVALSESLEQRITSRGVANLVAALVIAAGLYPVSRLTRRLSDRLMPGVANTDEYRAQRRREIYRAALQRALLDGVVSRDEQVALDTLWKSLGLSGREAREMEREIRPA